MPRDFLNERNTRDNSIDRDSMNGGSEVPLGFLQGESDDFTRIKVVKCGEDGGDMYNL